MTVVFLVAWLLLATPRRIVRDLAVALALPVAYQIFRMGYFASLVPSTALAKDSGGLHLAQGWSYLTDLVGTYALWIPLVVLAVALVARSVEVGERARTIVVVALVLAGVLHGTYIVVTGGDYMHGRLLLPALFAVAAPATFALGASPRRRDVRRRRRGDGDRGRVVGRRGRRGPVSRVPATVLRGGRHLRLAQRPAR